MPLPRNAEKKGGASSGDAGGSDAPAYVDTYYDLWGASGLAGVWAEENTRESIYDALRRKETFATSGPRIRVRFFAGYDFADGLEATPDGSPGPTPRGVPMGGDLVASADRAPRFLVWAMRDPASAPLQRVQVIKGWVEGRQGARAGVRRRVLPAAAGPMPRLTAAPTTARR